MKTISHKIKRIQQFLLTILLLLSIAVMSGSAEPTTRVCVDPPYVLGTAVSETFVIKINITDVANLYGFEFRLCWNGTLIELTKKEIFLPWSPNFVAVNQYRSHLNTTLASGRSYYWLGASALPPAAAFNGNFTVARLTFHVEYAPEFPEPDMSTVLDLGVPNPSPPPPEAYSILSDPTPLPIDHRVDNGLYEIKTKIPPTPKLEVEPPTYTALALGEVFKINVNIVNLASAWKLFRADFKLGYNTTLLDTIKAEEGPFFKQFEGPEGTNFTREVYEALGYVNCSITFLGTPSEWPYGNGTLTTITFNAVYATAYPTIAFCVLDLYNTTLLDVSVNPITHTVSDGKYYAPSLKLGRAIDVYTQYPAPYGGQGPNMLSDAFSPQDEVILYAYATFADEPVKGKRVTFEIISPLGDFMIYRTNDTDANGLAITSFRIPWPSENPTRMLGRWTVTAALDIAQKEVKDRLIFQVGWIVELIKVETVDARNRPKVSFTIGDNIYFRLTFKSISMREKTVNFTIVAYDAVDTPIGGIIIRNFIVPPGLSYYFHIKPIVIKQAFVGEGKAFANVCVDLIALCPEISTTFQIAGP